MFNRHFRHLLRGVGRILPTAHDSPQLLIFALRCNSLPYKDTKLFSISCNIFVIIFNLF